ncbi:MAG: lysozyme [Bacteroidales bacterium]|jgi:lysozyme|nr:lysozyme [Bacteroidales bacterium]
MKTSQRGINLIKESESLQLTAYLCPAGVPTIGYGHTGPDVTPADVKNKKTITEAQAEALLAADLAPREHDVLASVRTAINQNQFDALVDFVFNLGIGNFRSSTLLKKINANPNDLSIADEFMKWVNSNKKPLKGLVIRRAKEVILYLS